MPDMSLPLTGLSYFQPAYSANDIINQQQKQDQGQLAIAGTQLDNQSKAISNQRQTALQSQDSADLQLKQLQLKEAQDQTAAMRDYRTRAIAGDPEAIKALAGYPQIQEEVHKALDGLSDDQRNAAGDKINAWADAVSAVHVAGPEGSQARQDAWNEQIDKLEKEGHLPADLAATARKQPPTDENIHYILGLKSGVDSYVAPLAPTAAAIDTMWKTAYDAVGLNSAGADKITDQGQRAQLTAAATAIFNNMYYATYGINAPGDKAVHNPTGQQPGQTPPPQPGGPQVVSAPGGAGAARLPNAPQLGAAQAAPGPAGPAQGGSLSPWDQAAVSPSPQLKSWDAGLGQAPQGPQGPPPAPPQPQAPAAPQQPPQPPPGPQPAAPATSIRSAPALGAAPLGPSAGPEKLPPPQPPQIPNPLAPIAPVTPPANAPKNASGLPSLVPGRSSPTDRPVPIKGVGTQDNPYIFLTPDKNAMAKAVSAMPRGAYFVYNGQLRQKQ